MIDWILDLLNGERRIKASSLKPGDELIVGFLTFLVKKVEERKDGFLIIDLYDYTCLKAPSTLVRIKRKGS